MQVEVDGRVAYAYTGGKPFDAALPTIVFVHGAQSDHSVWILQSRYLAHHGYGVLAVDLPGHGRSAGPLLESVEAMAEWIGKLMTAAGVRRATVVGHSMGSLIAVELAGSAPDRVAGAVLVGSAYPMRVSDALLAAARDDEPRAFDMMNVWSHGGLDHPPGCPGPGFSIFVQARRLMERQAKGVLFNDLRACNDYGQGEQRAAAITCPALFVLGKRDMMTPVKAGKALAARIRDARVVEVDDSGHQLMAEQPRAVLDAIRGFVGSAH
ncbi:MAG: alpha/beta hydrolase [Burkholderiaceae bacterium]